MGDTEFLAQELSFTARQLRLAGEGGLRDELQKAITAATRSIPGEIRSGLEPRLPDRYVREDFGPDLSISVSKRYGDTNPGVSVRARTRSGKARKLSRLNRGIIAHPFFGHRDGKWYNQPVVPGWFTEPILAARTRVREDITAALDTVAVKATRKG